MSLYLGISLLGLRPWLRCHIFMGDNSISRQRFIVVVPCSKSAHSADWCMIKIFRGGGVVDGEGGSSEGCLKWSGGRWGSLRDLSKNILKQGVGKDKSRS